MAATRHLSTGSQSTIGLEIRTLQPSDFDNGFFEALGGLRESGLTPDDGWKILRTRAQNVRTFVLLADGQVAATATLLVEKKFIHRGGVVGHIEDVATRPGLHGRGFATALIEHLLAEARSEGCYKVILDCDAALAPFYQRIGFRESGVCMRIDL